MIFVIGNISTHETSEIDENRLERFCSKASNRLRFRKAYELIKNYVDDLKDENIKKKYRSKAQIAFVIISPLSIRMN